MTNSMDLTTFREAASCATTRELEGSLPHSQELSNCPYPESHHITLSSLFKNHLNITHPPTISSP
jgi:hypothetical protein